MSDQPDETEAPEETADEAPGADDDAGDAGTENGADTEAGAGTETEETVAEAGEESVDREGEEPTDEPDEGGLEEGDFVRIAYTARTAEDDQLVDTTDEEVAEEEGVADQGEFEPRVIVLGQGHLFETVEDAILGSEVGDSGSVVVTAEEAFGEYDEEQVQTVSADKIDEDDRYPGARIQVDGRQGILETIIGGRARVDFNHPLAGQDIEYDYEILEVVEEDLEQARGLLNMFLDLDLEMWIETDEVEETRVVQPDEDESDEEDDAAEGETADDGEEGEAAGDADEDDEEPPEPETVTETVEKRTLYVESTPQLSMNQQWMMQKQQIAQQVIDLTDVDRILIQEILDGGGMGMGLGGMMGGMGGGGEEGVDIEEMIEEADIDADEIPEELE